MWSEEYHWHYDYVRLAWDTGFSFEKSKFPDLDKNKICIVDIDRIVRERDVATVERYIPVVIQYILDSDQAKVLDINFVKMFRISQLSVEYLLFCKKYLDNTIVLLKKEMCKIRSVNKDLKILNQELESHINSLTKLENITTFKCGKCLKVFSSEEYLNAHMMRRHIQDNENNTETDKLQSEIKQLKERLNNTEKLFQENSEKPKEQVIQETKKPNESEVKLIEIQEKFENFQKQVEGELRVLQIQKAFYEDKYGKLFDIVINEKEKAKPNSKDEMNSTTHTNCTDFKHITENTTQTENNKTLQVESTQNKNVFEFKESSSSSENLLEKDRTDIPEIDQKISKLEETLEAKVSLTLQNIEGQMQSFWNKLTELELNKQAPSDTKHTNTKDVLVEAKPSIKPRTKFSQPTKITSKNEENFKTLKLELDKFTLKSPLAHTNIPEYKISEKESQSSSESESSILEESNVKNQIMIKPSTSTLGKRSITSLKSIANNEELMANLSTEIESVVASRLQDLGISPSWKGLPKKSFAKSLEIIQHQASLTKKAYPKFYSVKEQIEKSLQKSLTNNKHSFNKKNVSGVKEKKQNIINIRCKQKQIRIPKPETNIIIKNRSLYDTDTESEISAIKYVSPKKSEDTRDFSAVIEDLKTLQKTKTMEVTASAEELKKSDTEAKGKGLLRDATIGFLPKKKVFFDIESYSSNAEDIPVIQKFVEGSTTSIASSVFEAKHEDIVKSDKNKENEKDVDSLSDFDLSS